MGGAELPPNIFPVGSNGQPAANSQRRELNQAPEGQVGYGPGVGERGGPVFRNDGDPFPQAVRPVSPDILGEELIRHELIQL